MLTSLVRLYEKRLPWCIKKMLPDKPSIRMTCDTVDVFPNLLRVTAWLPKLKNPSDASNDVFSVSLCKVPALFEFVDSIVEFSFVIPTRSQRTRVTWLLELEFA